MSDIKLTGEKFKAILLKSGTKQGSPYLFNIALDLSARAMWQLNEVNGIKTGKKEVRMSLLVVYTTWYYTYYI